MHGTVETFANGCRCTSCQFAAVGCGLVIVQQDERAINGLTPRQAIDILTREGGCKLG